MFQGWLDVRCHFSNSDIMMIICLNNHDYTILQCFWPIRLLNYRWFKSLIPPLNQLVLLVNYMMSSKWRRPLNVEQLTCYNAGIVTRCLLKLLHKHHATCALLAIQKSVLNYDRKVVKWRNDHECCHSDDVLSQYICRTPVPVILPASVPF